ncbi:BglG family transcription antiterminator [Enterococcus sp. HY326]|uniref:BglG family transcription antiterminator n=1 Tax=Enterococcus sp. HY326 TaxID=2971265 RepID=UPI00223F889F|nr:BglG family transcription antiterminator [Enterococcus sp. HY326]
MMDNQDLVILHEITFRNERTIENLETKLAMSKRQITYALKKVNELLNENSQEEICTSGSKLLISTASENFLQNYLLKSSIFEEIYHSKKNRQLMILLILSCSLEFLSLDHLIIMLDASRSTVLNDLKDIKILLAENNLEVTYSRKRGYYLLGNEENIRYALMQIVLKCLNEDHGELFLENFIFKYLEINSLDFEEKILEASQNYHIHFFENKLKEFTYCFILLNQRLKSYTMNSDYSKEAFHIETNEYKFSELICNYFEITDKQNISYVSAWIAGVSSGDITKSTNDKEMIEQIVRRLISRFESLAGIRFLDTNVVVRRLYEHVRPAYYRILYQLPIFNPLTEKIQKEYAEMYSLVKEALKPLQALFESELPSDEIAFLTVHFAASTYEEQEKRIKRNRGLVLCPSGIGTSLILVKELEALFPSIEFVTESSHEKTDISSFDIIFTTIITQFLFNSNIPFIVVNPIMNPKEKFELIGRVYEIINKEPLINPQVRDVLNIVKKHVNEEQYFKIENDVLMQSDEINSHVIIEDGGDYPLLSEVTSKKLVKLNVPASNWEEAIRNSTDVLVKEGKVLPSYIDGMIQTTRESGPYIVITKHVALPHARPESGAKEIAISIATLEHPVVFGNKENDPVKYVFGLSALDNKTHLTAMAELAELLDQKKFYDVLDTAKSPEEIIAYILKFESEE